MNREKFGGLPHSSGGVPEGQKMPERPIREEEDEDIEKTIIESIEGMPPMKEGDGLGADGKREILEKEEPGIGGDDIDALARQLIEMEEQIEKQDVAPSEERGFMSGLSPMDRNRVIRRAVELREEKTKEAEAREEGLEKGEQGEEVDEEKIQRDLEQRFGKRKPKKEDAEGIEALKERFGKPMEERGGETKIEWKIPETETEAGAGAGAGAGAEKAEVEEVEAVSATIVAEALKEAGLEVEPSGLKGVMRGFGRRLRSVRKVLGNPMPEFLIGIVAGMGVKTFARSVLTIAGLGAPGAALAGGVAGAGLGGGTEYWKIRGEHRRFIREIQGEEEDLTPERMAEKREELESKLKEEKDSKRQEALSDQLRYLLIEIKNQTKKKGYTLEDMIEDIVKASSKIEEKAYLTEQNKLLQEIRKAKMTRKKKVAWAVVKGALSGAVGGLLGGWVVDNFGVIRDLFGHLPGAEFLTSHLSPEPFGGEVFPPTEVMGGIIEEAAKESLGLDTAMFPSTINLEAGYSVWSTMAELLPDFGNTDLQEVVQEVCKASGVGVEEWNLPGRVIDRLLPVGFELEITPEVKEIIQAIIDKRG